MTSPATPSATKVVVGRSTRSSSLLFSECERRTRLPFAPHRSRRLSDHEPGSRRRCDSPSELLPFDPGVADDTHYQQDLSMRERERSWFELRRVSTTTNEATVDEDGHRDPRRSSLPHRRHRRHSHSSPFEGFLSLPSNASASRSTVVGVGVEIIFPLFFPLSNATC
ncbi:hypothetical protein V8G54_003162 [Vigna mungo]|uniref:Uncharacterized protein n=1 Tax=Vigna mungo TaxID=3915 RepID=A0AAQ3SCP1_VIGMU